MSSEEKSGAYGFKLAIDYPRGWVDLTEEALSIESAAKAAGAVVANQDMTGFRVSAAGLTRSVQGAVAALREWEADYGAALFSPDGHQVATLAVDLLGEPGKVVTPEVAEDLLGDMLKDFPRVTMDRHRVPAGEAVRARYSTRRKKMFGFSKSANECVMYWVCPSVSDNGTDVVQMLIQWPENAAQAAEIPSMADQMAQSLQVIPFDAAGNEIQRGGSGE